MRESSVVGELQRLPLLVGEPLERLLHARSAQTEPGLFLGVLPGLLRSDVERLRAAGLFPADEIDRAPVDQRQDPGAGLGALRDEAGGRPPDREEALLHRVLGERGIANDPQREAVGDAAEAVVELREGVLVGPRYESDQRLVREMSEPATHKSTPFTGCSPR